MPVAASGNVRVLVRRESRRFSGFGNVRQRMSASPGHFASRRSTVRSRLAPYKRPANRSLLLAAVVTSATIRKRGSPAKQAPYSYVEVYTKVVDEDGPASTVSPADLTPRGSALDVLSLIRSGRAKTRAELMTETGLSRSTISQRLSELFQANLVNGAGEASSTGGRPAAVMGFNPSAGVVLAAAVGVTGSRVAVIDLAGHIIAEHHEQGSIAAGPTATLERIAERARTLLVDIGIEDDDLWGFGVGLPGPVEFASGRAVSPPIMPGMGRIPRWRLAVRTLWMLSAGRQRRQRHGPRRAPGVLP